MLPFLALVTTPPTSTIPASATRIPASSRITSTASPKVTAAAPPGIMPAMMPACIAVMMAETTRRGIVVTVPLGFHGGGGNPRVGSGSRHPPGGRVPLSPATIVTPVSTSGLHQIGDNHPSCHDPEQDSK